MYKSQTSDIHDSGFDALLNRKEPHIKTPTNGVITSYGITTSAGTSFLASVKIDEILTATLTLASFDDGLGNVYYKATSIVPYKKINRSTVPVIIGFITLGTTPNEKRSLLPYLEGTAFNTLTGFDLTFTTLASVQANLTSATITVSASTNTPPTFNFTLFVLHNQ